MAAEKPSEIVVFITRSDPRCDFCGEDRVYPPPNRDVRECQPNP